jgi:transmembrane sensor
MNAEDTRPGATEDPVLDAAVAWAFERSEGFTAARERAFDKWCAADPRHAAALERVEQSVTLLEQMPCARGELDARFGPTEDSPRAEGAWRGAFAWAASLAAVFALAAGLVFWARPASQVQERHVADSGAARRVLLGDGSHVELNVGSEVHVRFTAGERRVVLARGEAYFDVAHEPVRPFVVTAGGVSVRAVGTAFNVRVVAHSVEVLVMEGRVELAREGDARPAGIQPVVAAAPRISAGERASVPRLAAEFAPRVEKADARLMREAFAWQDPIIRFSDTPMAEIAARFNRRNVTQLVLSDPELGARRIGGAFALDQPDAFARLLERKGEVVAERQGENEIVLRRVR